MKDLWVRLSAVSGIAAGAFGIVAAGCEDGGSRAIPRPTPSIWWRAGEPPLIECRLYGTVPEVEERIVLPKCGAAGDGTCHATGPAPPRIAEVGKIAASLLEAAPTLRCRQDRLVAGDDPANSDVLAKIRARGTDAVCSNGSDGGPGMPYQDAPQLTAEEAACLEWWVHEIARSPL